MTTKEMLAEVIRRAVLKPREKEDLVDLWDRSHRFGGMSDRQKAWVERVFYEQKLDRAATAANVRRRVVVPTWQKERRGGYVDTTSSPEAFDPPGAEPAPSVRLVPSVTSTAREARPSGMAAEQPSRIVTVKSTDIRARLQAKAAGVARPAVNTQRASSKSGTFMAAPSQKAYAIGYINYEGATRELLITNMASLHEHCPRIRPGSQQYQKIEKFFRDGGRVLKIKPSTSSRVA